MSPYNPPPPYAARDDEPTRPRARASITTLPLHLLHRIFSLTLDPQATPSLFSGDYEEEKVRRTWALFRGVRGVDRRFYLGKSTSSTSPELSLSASLHIHSSLRIPRRVLPPYRPRQFLGSFPTRVPRVPSCPLRSVWRGITINIPVGTRAVPRDSHL